MRIASQEVITPDFNPEFHYLADFPCHTCGDNKRYINSRKCAACSSIRGKKRYASHPSRDARRHKNNKYKKRYGIDLETAEIMLLSQGGRCAICGTEDPGRGTGFSVDHCHKTKFVRGMLCHNCNVGLGHFRDNVSFLNNAINYLDASRN